MSVGYQHYIDVSKMSVTKRNHLRTYLNSLGRGMYAPTDCGEVWFYYEDKNEYLWGYLNEVPEDYKHLEYTVPYDTYMKKAQIVEEEKKDKGAQLNITKIVLVRDRHGSDALFLKADGLTPSQWPFTPDEPVTLEVKVARGYSERWVAENFPNVEFEKIEVGY